MHSFSLSRRWLTPAFLLLALFFTQTIFAANVATPGIQVLAGATNTQFQARFTCATPAAVIRYTVDGTEPTTSSTVIASGGVVTVAQNVTLKAKAWDGNNPPTLDPSLVARVYNVFGLVAAGDDDTLVLKSDGRLWAAGLNSTGQLGDGTTTNRTSPVTVKMSTGLPLRNVTSVEGGQGAGSGIEHTVAATSDGFAWAWGSNSHGQLGNGETADATYPVKVMKNASESLEGVVMVAAGNRSSYALTNDGRVWSWGINNQLQLGTGSVAASSSFAAEVKVNSSTKLSDVAHIVQIAAGAGHVLALTETGSVYAWGYNANGQLGNGTNNNASYATPVLGPGGSSNVSEVSRIAAANHSSIAVRNGAVWAWGANDAGQLGVGNNDAKVLPTQMKAGIGASNFFVDVAEVAGGRAHFLLRKSNKDLWAVGANAKGQLGNGGSTNQLYPVQVKKSANTYLTGVAHMAGGYSHSVAVCEDGKVFTWGKNTEGALGRGNTSETDTLYAANYTGWPSTLYISTPITLTVESNSSVNPNSFLLTATPTGFLGEISKVEFYQGSTLVGTVTSTSGPWQLAVSSAALDQSFTAIAYNQNDTAAPVTAVTGTIARSFRLPLARAGHSFKLYRVGGGGTGTSPSSVQVKSITGVDGTGRFTLAADAYLEATFPMPQMGQFWLMDDTSGEFSQLNAVDLRETPWSLEQAYVAGGQVPASSIRHLMLPLSRSQHVLNLILDAGATFPVTMGSEPSAYGINPATSLNESRSLGFFAATAYPSNTSGFHILDLTAFEQAPASASDLRSVTWGPILLPTITRVASIALAAHNDGYAFTLHTSGGSLQGVTAASVTFPAHNNYAGIGASASVGIGETFWLTRDVDGASSPHVVMGISNQFVDWTAAFAPYRNLETKRFQIGANRRGHVLKVHHSSDGYLAPLTLVSDANVLTTWDDNGQPVQYAYDTFDAAVDLNQTWTLKDETTNEDLGSTVSVLEGWTPWHPSAPAGFLAVNISEFRHGHSLRLRQADGTEWNVQAAEGYESPGTFLQSWNTCFSGTPAQRTAAIEYFPGQAPFNPAQAFEIIDVDTGEEFSFDANLTGTADLSQWSGAPEPLTLDISVTRWAHELLLLQADGASYPITRGNLQGSWTPTFENQGWFTTYNYFDATTQRRPALEWWVYDVTAGEIADSYQGDLSQWVGPSALWDTDSDGLPDWYEFVLGTNIDNTDSDTDGIPDAWEARYGLNPNNATDAADLAQSGDLTNLQKYQHGLNPASTDSDGDGMSDAWELQMGLNPTDPADASQITTDIDYILTNLQMFQGYVGLQCQLPLGRSGHALHWHIPNIGGGHQSIASVSMRPTPATLDGEGRWQLEAGSYLRAIFVYLPTAVSDPEGAALVDSTTGESIYRPNPSGQMDFRGTAWTPEGTNARALCIALPMERFGHVFGVIRTDGVNSLVTSGEEQGENSYDPQTGTTTFHSYGFFTGLAYPGEGTGDLYVVDLTTREQAPANVADLALATWSPLTLPQAVRTVTLKLADRDAGYAFTLHTSGGSLQGVWPAWMTMELPGPGNTVSGYFVTGAVGAGESFWLTRDVDEASSPQEQMLVSDIWLNWSAQFAPVRNFQTYSFRIGGPRASHVLAVHHDDGLVSYLSNPEWGELTTWDNNGQPVFYTYYDYQAQVDTNQTWSLFDETTSENLGAITEVLDGWTPWHPNPPAGFVSILLPQTRHTHTILLRQDDGTTWTVRPAEGYTDPQAYLQAWNTYYAGTADERTLPINYYPAQAPFDPAQGFTIVDETAVEEVSFASGSGAADLSLWFGTPQPLSLNISVVRWSHELVLHLSNGESFQISRGSLQGNWAPDPQDRPLFTTYSYFDASTQFHPELEYWVFDVTTGESSPPNTPDLISWTGSSVNTDTDNDGLPDWYEFIIGTNPNLADTDGDGLNDGEELRLGLDPRQPGNTSDTDGDGIPDEAEILAGTDPAKKDAPGVMLRVSGFAAP